MSSSDTEKKACERGEKFLFFYSYRSTPYPPILGLLVLGVASRGGVLVGGAWQGVVVGDSWVSGGNFSVA